MPQRLLDLDTQGQDGAHDALRLPKRLFDLGLVTRRCIDALRALERGGGRKSAAPRLALVNRF